MPVSSISQLTAAVALAPQTVLNAGEFGVFPRTGLNLRIPNVKNGVVALSELGLSHVVAAHFESPIDAWKNVQNIARAADWVHLRKVTVDLLYLSSSGHVRTEGYPGPLPGRIPVTAINADTFANDLQQAFDSKSPDETLLPGERLDSDDFKSVLIPIDTRSPFSPRPSAPVGSRYEVHRSMHLRNTTERNAPNIQSLSVLATGGTAHIYLNISDQAPCANRAATSVRAGPLHAPMKNIS
jgi:hypothetical protein